MKNEEMRKDDIVYRTSVERLIDMIHNKILVKDEQEHIYIYSLEYGEKEYIGVISCINIDEYLDGNIKKKKILKPEKLQDRYTQLNRLNANIAPALLTYKNNVEIEDVLKDYINENQPEYNFEDDQNVIQKVWVINDNNTNCKLVELFKEVKKMYLIDGHYEVEATAKIAIERRANNKRKLDRLDKSNYFLTALFSDKEISVKNVNICVKNISGLDNEKFFDVINKSYDIQEVFEGYKPNMNEIVMYNKKWYKIKSKINGDDFDVYRFEKTVLFDILNENTVTESESIEIHSCFEKCKKLVDSNEYTMFFTGYNISIDEFIELMDRDSIASLKSVSVVPKLRNGLFIRGL